MRTLKASTVLMILFSGTALLGAAPAPSPAKIRQAVTDHFVRVSGYRDGDIIDRSQVESILAKLKSLGYRVSRPEAIAARALEPNQWLVSELRTTAGRAFMRQVIRYPGSYDRLDRLSAMPHGKQTIRDLIRGPDGYKMLQYMTTQQGGRELGKMLSRGPADFNRPTGRIYTAEGLIAELQQALQSVTGRGVSP